LDLGSQLEWIGDEVGHGEDRRSAVEGESVAVNYASATAGQLFSLHHSDVVLASCEIARARQAGQPGPDYDNRVHVCRSIMIIGPVGGSVRGRVQLLALRNISQ
jgi:hypothetical protein